MSKNLQNVILTSALAGLVAGAVACGKKSEPAPAPEAKTEAAPMPDTVERTGSVTGGTTTTVQNPAAVPAHACKGQNECKGQGGCAVEGQNDCKGKNPCKGKGGCKTA